MKDLAIAIRISPFLNKWHALCFRNKFELVATCMLSLREALNNTNTTVYAILDRCPVEYKKLLYKIFGDIPIYTTEIKYNSSSWEANVITFKIQNIILYDSPSDILLFQEDDYIYFKKIRDILDFMRNYNADIVSPYCHPWTIKYWKKFIDKCISFRDYLFFSVPSTTNTFFITKKSLKETLSINLNYYNELGDLRRCLILTKNIKPLRFDLPHYRYRITLLKYLKLYIRLRKYSIFMPYPTVAIHVQEEETIRNYINRIEEYKKKSRELIKDFLM